jgi:hypothetical protein
MPSTSYFLDSPRANKARPRADNRSGDGTLFRWIVIDFGFNDA